MPRYFWMLGLQRVVRQQVGRDRWQMDCLCQTRHQQTCDERRGKADEKLFHTILRAADAPKPPPFPPFSQSGVFPGCLPKPLKTQHNKGLYYLIA